MGLSVSRLLSGLFGKREMRKYPAIKAAAAAASKRKTTRR